MEFNIDAWMNELIAKITEGFTGRIVFIGLQGSFRRNEATERSDIDVILILDELSIHDLQKYGRIVSEMPHSEKACGFVSGLDEITHWDKSELFQFYHDTRPIQGSLDFLLPLFGQEDIRRAVKIGACSLYHTCCHNYLFDHSREILSGVYKSVFFLLQALVYLEEGEYLDQKTELAKRLTGPDLEMLQACMQRPGIPSMPEEQLVTLQKNLLSWCSRLIREF